MPTNFKNDQYLPITSKQTLPASADGTGTISTLGTAVIGIGTSFKTEMPLGSWLVDLSANEIRIVKDVTSDTLARLENAFTSDISASTTPNIIHRKDLGVVAISVKAIGGDVKIDGYTLQEGESLTFDKDRDRSSHRDLVDPIIADPNGNTINTIIFR